MRKTKAALKVTKHAKSVTVTLTKTATKARGRGKGGKGRRRSSPGVSSAFDRYVDNM